MNLIRTTVIGLAALVIAACGGSSGSAPVATEIPTSRPPAATSSPTSRPPPLEVIIDETSTLGPIDTQQVVTDGIIIKMD